MTGICFCWMIVMVSYNYGDVPNKITFQELFMHNADGDMETLLDIYGHGGKEVGECDGPLVIGVVVGRTRMLCSCSHERRW